MSNEGQLEKGTKMVNVPSQQQGDDGDQPQQQGDGKVPSKVPQQEQGLGQKPLFKDWASI